MKKLCNKVLQLDNSAIPQPAFSKSNKCMHMPARIFIVASMAKKKKNYCSAFLVLNSFTALKAAIIPLAGI